MNDSKAVRSVRKDVAFPQPAPEKENPPPGSLTRQHLSQLIFSLLSMLFSNPNRRRRHLETWQSRERYRQAVVFLGMPLDFLMEPNLAFPTLFVFAVPSRSGAGLALGLGGATVIARPPRIPFPGFGEFLAALTASAAFAGVLNFWLCGGVGFCGEEGGVSGVLLTGWFCMKLKIGCAEEKVREEGGGKERVTYCPRSKNHSIRPCLFLDQRHGSTVDAHLGHSRIYILYPRFGTRRVESRYGCPPVCAD